VALAALPRLLSLDLSGCVAATERGFGALAARLRLKSLRLGGTSRVATVQARGRAARPPCRAPARGAPRAARPRAAGRARRRPLHAARLPEAASLGVRDGRGAPPVRLRSAALKRPRRLPQTGPRAPLTGAAARGRTARCARWRPS